MSNIVMPGTSGAGTPSCSVVICTRDRPEQLDQCLEAVAHLDYPRFDVLVVDNAPRNGMAREIAARRGVRYLFEPLPGQNRARNRGAHACDTEIVAYIDDDEVPEPSWLCGLVAEFKDPQVIAVTGRILPLNSRSDVGSDPGLRFNLDLGEERRTVDKQTSHWFEVCNFGGIGLGGNMAFRRRAFKLWPGFDERFEAGTPLPGCGEHYAFFSMVERGYRIIYTPNAVVYHPVPQSLNELRARHLKAFTAMGGYLTLLFLEHDRYRRALIRFSAGWLMGTPRTWRTQAAAPRPRIVPRWRELLSCVKGLLFYARTLFEKK